MIFRALGFWALLTLLASCGESEAYKMGQQWCECHNSLAPIASAMQKEKETEKRSEMVRQFIEKSEKVVDCMGGEQKLLRLQEEVKNKDKFQKQYDAARQQHCADLVKLLRKKATEEMTD